MALRKLESFGWLGGAASTWLPYRWSLASGTPTWATPGRRAGSNYITFANAAWFFGHVLDNQQTWIVHCALMIVGTHATATIVGIGDAAAAVNQVMLRYNTATQRIELYRGNAATLLATSSRTISTNVWHHLIFAATIDNAAGSAEARIDGETIITYSGDTQQSVNAYGNQILFNGHSFHDIVICDGAGAAPYNGILGDVRVNCLIPNAAGASSAWTPSAGANYQNVDDTTPDSDSTYNATLTAGAVDSYSVPNPTLTGLCRGVAVAALVRKDDAGTRTLRPILHDAGVPANYQGTTRNLADSYAFHEDIWPVHPGTGVDFTQTQLNNAQPGVQLVS